MSQNIKNIEFDDNKSDFRSTEINHDLKVAIYDLIEKNYFVLLDSNEKSFKIGIKLTENNLTIDVFSDVKEISLRSITVNVKKLLKLLREYIILCDSYYSAIKSAPVSKVEAIDMGRRSLHDLASEEFIKKLKNHIDIDLNTATRFVTVISVLLRGSSSGFDSYYSE